MPTSAVYYTDPLNIDYLMASVRLNFGDLEGNVYSDTTVRTAIVNAIRFLQRQWASRYQIFDPAIVVEPQPEDVPSGYVLANTVDGQIYIPDGLTAGDVFRNPFLQFTSYPPPVISLEDETPIVLAATFLLRKAQVASSSDELVSWSTEDIRYTNLSKERSLSRLLEADKLALDEYFRRSLAAPVRIEYPIGYIPGLDEVR